MTEIPEDILERARTFCGDGRQLEAALGAYVVGQLYGWRALAMMHTTATRQRFDRILGVRLNDVCPEHTGLTDRLLGIRIADQVGAFWKVATRAEYGDRHVLGDPADG